MSKKDNFSQAAYEMFGIGKGAKRDEKPAETSSAGNVVKKSAPSSADMELTIEPTAKAVPAPKAPEPPKTTVLAEGSVFEGTLHAKGNVEIAGTFKGDVFSEGDIKLFSDIEGNVSGSNVELVTSKVKGDVIAKGILQVGQKSAIGGNVQTRDIISSGSIEGNVLASGRATLANGSSLAGDLTAASLNVMEGAALEGRFKVATKAAEKK